MKTTIPKVSEVTHDWHVVDATGKPAGRLAVEISRLLRGKHKRDYTPHVDQGDFVVVINAEQVKLTGRKEEQKIYEHYTGFASGLKRFTAATIRERNPQRIVSAAVKGMMPKNRQSRQMLTRLKVYAGSEHPHAAQQPKPVNF